MAKIESGKSYDQCVVGLIRFSARKSRKKTFGPSKRFLNLCMSIMRWELCGVVSREFLFGGGKVAYRLILVDRPSFTRSNGRYLSI